MVGLGRGSRCAALALALCLCVTACGTGPESGRLQVVMTQAGSGTASVVPSFALAGPPGAVAIESIESIVLNVVRIDLKPASVLDEDSGAEEGSEEGTPSGWIRLPVLEGTTVDLLSLPATGGQVVGEGQVAATTFKEIRLVCDGAAMLTLSEAVTVAGGVVIGDDEPLQQPLEIPSCSSSGLKIKGGTFIVPADGEGVATVEVATDATVQSLSWNAQGFSMSPVINIKN